MRPLPLPCRAQANHPLRLLLATVACSWASSAFGLNPELNLHQYHAQTWTRQNGLPADGVTAIAQTTDGFIWLGSQRGLIRFDGTQFSSVPLRRDRLFRNQIISALVSDGESGLWFGLRGSAFGRLRADGTVSTVDAAWVQPGLNVIELHRSADGTLWLGTHAGLGRVARDGENSLLADLNTANHVVEDAEGRIWFSTTQHGVNSWHQGRLTQLPDPSLEKQQISALAVDRDGRLWVGTVAGLRAYDRRLQRVPLPDLQIGVNDLLIDRHGILWIGTASEGLIRFKDGRLSKLAKLDGLASDSVHRLCEDTEGNLWVGTSGGLTKLNDVKFPILTQHEGLLGGECHDVSVSARGGVWISGSAGVSYYDGRRVENFTADHGITSVYIKRAFESRDGSLYLLNGNRGVEILTGGKVVATHPFPRWPVAVAEDAEGVVVAVGDELFRVPPKGDIRPYRFPGDQKPPLYWIRNLLVSRDGALWIASVNGLVRVGADGLRHWLIQDGLPDNDVQCLAEDDDGVIWAGLTTGVVRVKDGHVRPIGQAEGLLDDTIFGIVPDRIGNLWLRSSQGILRVSRQDLHKVADKVAPRVNCTVFNDIHDLKSIDTTSAEFSGCRSADGRIWFPSPLGPIVITPDRIRSNPTAPLARVEAFRANGEDYPTNFPSRLPPGRGDFEFRFTAPTFIAPHRTRFRYRLDGYDQGWHETENRRVAFYTNLRPGEYRFRVMAANADGVWSDKSDSLEITLAPHFHQTGWFYALCGILVAGAAGGAYYVRIRRLKLEHDALQRNRLLLESQVRERTAELASANESLVREIQEREQAQAELKDHAQRLEQEIEERIRMQAEIERVHRQLMDASRKAGMAEVATGVLHNVGNVLNSVNVSASLVSERAGRSRAAKLHRVLSLLAEHEHDLAAFLTGDPKGRQIAPYLRLFADDLARDETAVREELAALTKNVAHIKDIVAMQQSFAKAVGVIELVPATELAEDALRVNLSALERHGVAVTRDYRDNPTLPTERHKVIQILVNLIANAKYACSESGRPDKHMVLRVQTQDERLQIEVVDNGVGIASENLTQIFTHGYTTRKHGHGFGLHSCALAARELGGSLEARSSGVGSGASFVLTLPIPSAEADDGNKPPPPAAAPQASAS